MNKVFSNIILAAFLIGLGAVSCSKATTPQKKVNEAVDLSYSENLSQYNPQVEGLPSGSEEKTEEVIQTRPMVTRFDISDSLNKLLDSVRVGNDTIRMINGFTVLVYSGNDQTEAGRVRNRLFDIVPELDARFSYKLPTYFVKVGQFYQQIEAQTLYRKIRSYYPTASIVPDKFPIEQ
ncbi:hypothetical protein [Roseivirga misakiensis]|uniref:SPOR domain-containing protein n=1 Tax=Roseivirga misakiensis TaxID=1563681 RepID=A0A1E5T3F8_9BACT|nr:hypothetical protein [Roseivirga misakiensis]OEK05925.1 hypothetical protein BFP71_07375 [Roseivirga misakiensis]